MYWRLEIQVKLFVKWIFWASWGFSVFGWVCKINVWEVRIQFQLLVSGYFGFIYIYVCGVREASESKKIIIGWVGAFSFFIELTCRIYMGREASESKKNIIGWIGAFSFSIELTCGIYMGRSK